MGNVGTVHGIPASSGGGGVTDHGGLTGLGDDDHPQYAEIANAETITGLWGFSTHPTGLDHGNRQRGRLGVEFDSIADL